MPDRFGQAGDYGQTFAYLYDQNLAMLERNAEEADQRREEDLAAKDEQVFARYNAGKLGDEALLAYIRKRISETAYDKGQQANWRKALLEYTESINDGRAAAAFEKTNDYAGYISYLRGKAAGMKGNSAKRAEIEKQISALIAQRDQGSVTQGADRILLKIQKGKASYSDLLDFYRERLKTVSDPGLKAQIRDQITQLTGKVRADNLTRQFGDLARQYDSGKGMSPQEYGRRMQELANRSGLRQSDPAQYNSIMEEARTLSKMVLDTGQLDIIAARLTRKEITPEQAARLYLAEAERWRVTDPAKYEAIRTIAWETERLPIPGMTPLPNAGVLGLPDGFQPSGNGQQQGETPQAIINRNVSKIFRFISQLDGSEFAQVNCVMGASAMLAWSMGYREQGGGAITGGDLRYLTGDREMGTNLDQAEYALGQLGIAGLRNRNDNNIAFEAFKKHIGQKGQSAVLMGVYANMPPELRANPTLSKGHGIFIAAYDSKKNAFLVYDPAVSKNTHPDYKGVWMDASVIKNYGWGPSHVIDGQTYSFHGQVLMSPPGTIKGTFSADGVRGRGTTDLKFVSVDDAPARRSTPKNYKGLTHKGPSTVASVDNRAVDRNGKPRMGGGRKAGDDFVPTTVEELRGELEKNQKRLDLIGKLSEARGMGKDRIEIGGKTYLLDDALFNKLDQETLDLYDEDMTFARAMESEDGSMPGWARDVLNSRTEQRVEFLAGAAARNSLSAATIMNTAIRDGLDDYKRMVADPDPSVAIKGAQMIGARLRIIGGVLKQRGESTETPLDDLSQDDKVPGNVQDIDGIIALFDSVSTPSQEPMSERIGDILGMMQQVGAIEQNGGDPGNDLGNLVGMIRQQRDAQDRIDRGEAVPVIDGSTGNLEVIPLKPKVDFATGQQTMVPAVDGLIQIPVANGTDVEMRWVMPGQVESGFFNLIPSANWESPDGTVKFTKDVRLTNAQLRSMPAGTLAQMVAAGQLSQEPVMLTSVTMPKVKRNGDIVPGQTFVQDPGSGAWWSGPPPVDNFGDRNLANPSWVGASPDGQPEWGWRANATAGMFPTPYSGSRKLIQEAADAGFITIPQTLSRGDDGNLSEDPLAAATFISSFDPLTPRNQMGLPSVKEDRDEDPGDRADRIEEGIRKMLEGARQAQDAQDYANIWGIETGEVDPTAPTNTGTPTSTVPGQVDSPYTTPAPRGDPRYQPTSPVALPGGMMGPQGGLDAITDVGRSLGVNIPKGTPMGPQGLPGPKSTPMGPQGALPKPKYGPPAPKKTTTTPRQSNLPRIGGSVMVGGTQVNLPPSQRKPDRREKDDVYKPPPPSQNSTQSNSVAAAAAAMIRRSPQQNGNY